jgi:hypothetical protein
MIETYFSKLDDALRDFPAIRSYALTRKVYNHQQGFIDGKIVFENAHSLEFIEVVDVERGGKIKYRYQYTDEAQNLIFRCDNSSNNPQACSFQHHKHTPGGVAESQEPDLAAVLFEISRIMHKNK